MARLLITGGAGYVGSHACLRLLEAGHQIVVFDNLSTASIHSIDRIRELSRSEPAAIQLIEGDICSPADLLHALTRQPVDAVLHFAGLKSVEASAVDSELYWQVNVEGSRYLLTAMEAAGCRRLIFSSSAAVYGEQTNLPITEAAPLHPANPYGASKAEVEQLLMAQAQQPTGRPWTIACLRYFNAVGAHPSGKLGENPRQPPSNLFPAVCQVINGERKQLMLWGNDWPTPDGTCIRDYIHVQDLAEGHLAALQWLFQAEPGCITVNLGTGSGISVLQVLNSFEQQIKQAIPRLIAPRRPGDIAESIADPRLAATTLHWRARHSLQAMTRDAIRASQP